MNIIIGTSLCVLERQNERTNVPGVCNDGYAPQSQIELEKRQHHRHHRRQPGEQKFPIQLYTGKSNIKQLFSPIFIFTYNENNHK